MSLTCLFLLFRYGVLSQYQSRVYIPQTRPPTTDPLPNATHHRPSIHSSAPLITDCISTAINTTHRFTSLSFLFSLSSIVVFNPTISLPPPSSSIHAFNLNSVFFFLFLLFNFYPFIATWLYRFGFSDGLWVMCGQVCGLWWMAGMFCRYWWWLGCGFWWVAKMVCGSDCCGLHWGVGHLFFFFYFYYFFFFNFFFNF